MARKSRKRPRKGPAKVQKKSIESRSGLTSVLCNIVRSKIACVVALVIAGFAIRSDSLREEEEYSERPKITSPPPTYEPPPKIPPREEVRDVDDYFPPVFGVYKTLPPTKTCNIEIGEFKRANMSERFSRAVKNCQGRWQKGRNTFLKTTIPGYHADGMLFNQLDSIFNSTGYADDLPQAAFRTFIFHRSDGKDGLPGGNISFFSPAASTSIEPNISVTLTSIPLNGDNRGDVAALATEICQSRMVAERDDIKAESTCNSFGLAIRCVYGKFPYSKYRALAKDIIFVTASDIPNGLNSGTRHRIQPIREKVYQALVGVLGSQPDILKKD